MSGVQGKLRILCEQLGRHSQLEQAIRDAGAGAALDALRAITEGDPAVGGDPAEQRKRENELLDEIEDACIRSGLSPLTVRTVRGFEELRLPPGFGTEKAQRPWVCPRHRCDRVVYPDEAAQPPECLLVGGPMQAFRPG
jgi:hypothetical protein